MILVEQSVWNIAQTKPGKVAVVSGKNSVTYQQLCCRALSAKEFLSQKLNQGDVLILSAGKQIEFLYAYLGAHLSGIIVVPIAPDTNSTRLQHILRETGAKLLVGFECKDVQVESLPLKEFADLGESLFSVPPFPDENAVADILFTTGTTGLPKGVPLTFNNEAAAARNINVFVQNTSEDIELLALPISHSFGLGRIRCCLSIGSTIIILGSFANVKKLYRTIEENHVTGFTMVPASWRYLKKFSGDTIKKYADQLRYIEMGSAFFSVEEKQHLANLLPNSRVCMHYGLTEASRSAFMEFHEDSENLNTVGKPSPFTEIEIFDEQGNILPTNTEGELCVKGEHVMKGYLNHPIEGDFFGSYFRTGDWGYKNAEGYICLKSRKKELINVGGKKVSPIEIEDQLIKIKGIKDCACVGVNDPEGILGEVVKAFIVEEPQAEITFEEIAAQLQGHIEDYKMPVQYQWIDAIPRTQSGKIQRFQLL